MSKIKKGKPKRRSKSVEGDQSPLPTKDDILSFIQENPHKANKREIGRAFGIKGAARIPLKRMLKELVEEGHIDRHRAKSFHVGGDLPPVTVIEVTEIDLDGELLAKPQSWQQETPPPSIILAPSTSSGKGAQGKALAIGDHILARLTKIETGQYEARVIRKLDGPSTSKILGVYQKVGRDGRVMPIDKKSRREFSVREDDAKGARSGDLVSCEVMPGRGLGARRAKVTELIGPVGDARSISLIAIHAQNIPFEFSEETIQQAIDTKPAPLKGRTDLRDLPFVTIDPADARDHDDAVWAEPDTSDRNTGGWIVWVAIADVAHYVTPESALDREALHRGNSCYFPDRVVPMLPEQLSADLCSLHEAVDRPCLAVRMTFSTSGKKISHEFIRGMMKSAGSLTYAQVQAAIDGQPDAKTKPLLKTVVNPLSQAYNALSEERDRRQPLALNLPEHRIELDDEGHVARISLRQTLDAHRLIEEFMIQANVCAAETLEKKNIPLIYRVHDGPGLEKLEALRTFLQSLDLKLTKGQAPTPAQFNGILNRVRGNEFELMVHEVVLRSQSQAVYATENLGHFGLNLSHYAHFTSPIRRYADLIVHRALIRACNLGEDGLTDEQIGELSQIAETISGLERRAMMAERESNDRYIAAYMKPKIGATFHGRISGVTRFGLFIRLNETGADGLVPIRTLGRERFHHDEKIHALIGESSGDIYRLGTDVEIELKESTPLTGGLIFEMISEPEPGRPRKGRTSSNKSRNNRKPTRSKKTKRKK